MLLWSSVDTVAKKKKLNSLTYTFPAKTKHCTTALWCSGHTVNLTWVYLVPYFLHFRVLCWWFRNLKWSPSRVLFLGARRLHCTWQRKCVLNNFVQAWVISAIDHKFSINQQSTKWSIFKQKHTYHKVMYWLMQLLWEIPAARSSGLVFSNPLFVRPSRT